MRISEIAIDDNETLLDYLKYDKMADDTYATYVSLEKSSDKFRKVATSFLTSSDIKEYRRLFWCYRSWISKRPDDVPQIRIMLDELLNWLEPY